MSGILQTLLAGGVRLGFSFVTPSSIVVSPTVATASFNLQADGDIDATATNNTIADRDDWLAPKIGMSGYEVRATLQSGGPMTTGTMGSYLALSSDRTWTLVQSGIGSIGAVVRYEFRKTGDTAILLTKDVTFNAQVN